jgi:hypothetical protein
MTLKIYITIIALLVCINSFGQKPVQRTPKTPEQRAVTISKDLGISKEKAMELITLIQPIDQEFATVLADTLMDRNERRARLRQLGDEKRAKIKSLLTPEQEQKLQAVIQERNAEQFARIRQQQDAIRKKIEEKQAESRDSSQVRSKLQNINN